MNGCRFLPCGVCGAPLEAPVDLRAPALERRLRVRIPRLVHRIVDRTAEVPDRDDGVALRRRGGPGTSSRSWCRGTSRSGLLARARSPETFQCYMQRRAAAGNRQTARLPTSWPRPIVVILNGIGLVMATPALPYRHVISSPRQRGSVGRAERRAPLEDVEPRRFEPVEDPRGAEPGEAQLVAEASVARRRRRGGRARTARASGQLPARARPAMQGSCARRRGPRPRRRRRRVPQAGRTAGRGASRRRGPARSS